MKIFNKNSVIIKWVIWAIIVLVIILVIGYWMAHRKKPVIHVAAATIPTVEVEHLKYQVFPKIVEGYGQTASPNSVTIKPQFTGVIESILFKAGDHVKAGQPLFILKSINSTQQIEYAKSILNSVEQSYVRLKKQYELNKAGVSEIDLIQAKSQYEQALVAYNLLKTQNTVMSPIDGVISSVKSDLAMGDIVNAGQLLATITKNINNKSVLLKYTLPSQYANQLKPGQKVIFTPSYSHDHILHTYNASVSYISPDVDAKSSSVTLRAYFIDNFTDKNKVLPNVFGKIKQVIDPNYKALAVKQYLVQTDAKGFFIYVFKDHKVLKKYFKPLLVLKSGLIPIASGLESGDLVIITNPSSLSPNEKINLKV